MTPDHPPTWGLVIHDIGLNVPMPLATLVAGDAMARDELGRQRYGIPLTPHNGRDSMRDAYEELLDASVYLKAAFLEAEAEEPATEAGRAVRSDVCSGLMRQYMQALRMCAGPRDLMLRRDGR